MDLSEKIAVGGIVVSVALWIATPILDRAMTPAGKLTVKATASPFSVPPGLDSIVSPRRAYPWGDIIPDSYFELVMENVGDVPISKALISFPRALYWCHRIGETSPRCSSATDSTMSVGPLLTGISAFVDVWANDAAKSEGVRQLRVFSDGKPVPVVFSGVIAPQEEKPAYWLIPLCVIAIAGAYLLRRGYDRIIQAHKAEITELRGDCLVRIRSAKEWTRYRTIISQNQIHNEEISNHGQGDGVVDLTDPEPPSLPEL